MHFRRSNCSVIISIVIHNGFRSYYDTTSVWFGYGNEKRCFAFNVILFPWNLNFRWFKVIKIVPKTILKNYLINFQHIPINLPLLNHGPSMIFHVSLHVFHARLHVVKLWLAENIHKGNRCRIYAFLPCCKIIRNFLNQNISFKLLLKRRNYPSNCDLSY